MTISAAISILRRVVVRATAARRPSAPLVAAIALWVLTASLPTGAQSFEVLYNFGFPEPDGRNPYAGVIADLIGNLYGTTYDGGAYGYGTVYELAAGGTETVLYNFTGGKDGGKPVGGLIRDPAGNLYGTTEYGGHSGGTCPISGGCGVVFRVSPEGAETVLYRFTGGSDGAAPLAGLARDTAGNLYGATSAGGILSSNCPSVGCGVVFKLGKGGQVVLHSFAGYPTDGNSPQAGLIIDGAGNLYGTALGGSTGAGAVFEIDSSGNEAILHDFEGFPADGAGPYASLVRDAAGNLYGTTFGGGAYGFGTVFELDPTGSETILYSFTGKTDGGWPFAGVVLDPRGNLYGTTASFGNLADCDGNGCGVVFEVSPMGKEIVLHAFDSLDGTAPFDGLLPYKGYLYGTTKDGGGGSDGEVFKVQP